jgi:hypothetical protein
MNRIASPIRLSSRIPNSLPSRAIKTCGTLVLAFAAIDLAAAQVTPQANDLGVAQPQTTSERYTVSVPWFEPSFEQSLAIPRFDSGLGTLRTIEFTLSAQIRGLHECENLSPNLCPLTATVACTCTLLRPDHTAVLSASPQESFTYTLQGFDGTIDFQGPSGSTDIAAATDTAHAASPPPQSDISLFSGPAGNPGTVRLEFTSMETSNCNGPANGETIFIVWTSAVVTVCYIYEPAAFHVQFGDGGAPPCPRVDEGISDARGNDSSVTCSAFTLASGIGALSLHALRLASSDQPATALSLSVQGDASINAATPPDFRAHRAVRCRSGCGRLLTGDVAEECCHAQCDERDKSD